MVRTQVQLSPAQADAVKRYAAEQGISMAEVVRRSLEEYLRGSARPTREDVLRRAREAAGALNSGCPDLARRHDDYLVEAFEQ